MTLPLTSNIALASLRKADENHAAVAQRSSRLFVEDTIRDMEGFGREAELLLRGLHSADVALGVFDHNRYNPVVEVGDADFRGPMPVVSQPEWMRPLVSLLEKDYGPFPADSVHWFSRVLGDMTFEERPEIEIFHCGIAFTRTDGRPVRLFSKGVPIHYTGDRRFTVTFTFVQNAHLLLKPSFREYWIRIVYGHDGTGAAREDGQPDLSRRPVVGSERGGDGVAGEGADVRKRALHGTRAGSTIAGNPRHNRPTDADGRRPPPLDLPRSPHEPR